MVLLMHYINEEIKREFVGCIIVARGGLDIDLGGFLQKKRMIAYCKTGIDRRGWKKEINRNEAEVLAVNMNLPSKRKNGRNEAAIIK